MTEKVTKKRNKNREILLIAVIVVLVIINGVKWFVDAQQEAKMKEEMENKEMEMVLTYAKLDSISGQLDSRISEIEELGGEIDSLLQIKEQLENEKIELKLAKNLTQERYRKIKSKVGRYETLLKQKDEEIEKLKVVNQALLDENIALKEQENTLRTQLSSLEVQRNKLTEKVSAAATLRAIQIGFTGINRKGKEKESEEFRVREVEKLTVAFTIEQNDLAEIGTKRIYLRIIDPDGSVLYNLGAGSGNFEFKGEKIFYSATKEFLFDNSGQRIQFTFDKGSDFKKGQYIAELYAEGEKIGDKSFVIR